MEGFVILVMCYESVMSRIAFSDETFVNNIHYSLSLMCLSRRFTQQSTADFQ